MALGVAMAGHLAGGGAVPGTPAVLVAGALATALAYRLSDRRWSVRTLGGLVLGVQGAVHLWCSLTLSPVAEPTAASPDAAMLLGHALATVATVALLRRGEHALLALGDAVVVGPSRRLSYASRPCVAAPATHSHLPARTRPVRPHLLIVLATTLTRRGPPVCA